MIEVRVDGGDELVKGLRALPGELAPASPKVAKTLGQMGAYMVDANVRGTQAGQDVGSSPFVPIKQSTAMSPVGRFAGKKTMRVRGPGHPLVNTGTAIRSLLYRVAGQTAEAFFGDATAARIMGYHYWGTDPYTIVAKTARIRGPDGKMHGGVLMMPGLAATKQTKTVTAKGLIAGAVFRPRANHPGLPRRRMLGFRPGDADAIVAIASKLLGVAMEVIP